MNNEPSKEAMEVVSKWRKNLRYCVKSDDCNVLVFHIDAYASELKTRAEQTESQFRQRWRDEIRAKWGHKKDGKCECAYCRHDFETLEEHAAFLEVELASERRWGNSRDEITAENAELRERLRIAERALMRKGYRQSCDIPACNCGDNWNHGGNAEERLREIHDEVWENGVTVLDSVKRLKERAEKAERGLANQERVLEVSNDIFRDAVRPILHLWPEAERPPGVQTICLKLAQMERERDEARAALAASKNEVELLCKSQNVRLDGYRELGQKVAHTENQRDEARMALKALVEKLEAVHADSRYETVWATYSMHGGHYTGPFYVDELKAAKAILSQTPPQPAPKGEGEAAEAAPVYEHPWPDCKEVQCKQSHLTLNTIMEMLGIKCDDNIYVVGKAVRIGEAISARDAALRGCVEALERIERWRGEFPDTGQKWNDGTPVSYGAAFGSNGERDYMRDVARQALAAASTVLGKESRND